jgi:hypothetical protein
LKSFERNFLAVGSVIPKEIACLPKRRRKMKKIFFAVLIAAFILAACGASRSAEAPAQYGNAGGGGAPQDSYAVAPAAPAPITSEGAAKNLVADSSGGAQATTVERLVIQNVDMSIVVSDPKTKMDEIAKLAKGMGGYVVSSNLYQSYTQNGSAVPEASLVVRVPAEKLDEALEKIKKDVVEVQSETRSGEDVTAQYVDLKSRLTTYEDALAQLEKIMAEKTTPEEVLNVFNQMMYYREQIELIKGQMKYYEEASALSAITLKLVAEATLQPLEIGGWKPQGVARDSIQSLIYFWQGFIDFMIRFLLLILPVLITIFIPFYLAFLLIRAIYRRVRRKKPAPTIENK